MAAKKRQRRVAQRQPDPVEEEDEEEDDRSFPNDADEEDDEEEEDDDPRDHESAEEEAPGDGESKRDAFKRIIEPRLSRALKSIRLVANVGKRSSYEYTSREAQQIISLLKDATEKAELAYSEQGVEEKVSLEFDE